MRNKEKLQKILPKTITIVILMLVTPALVQGEVKETHKEFLKKKIARGYSVKAFKSFDAMYKERVDRRNNIEKLIDSAQHTLLYSSHKTKALENEKLSNAYALNKEIYSRKKQRELAASTGTEFNYIKFSDGMSQYFKNGLVSRIKNARRVDEFGNVSLENRHNIKHNDKRLLISYESDIKDSSGNIAHIRWYGAKYSADSVFYGDYETSANRNLTEYRIEEINHAGNVKTSRWKALQYEGKLVRTFYQEIKDSIYGNVSFTRDNINYGNNSKGHPTREISYHEKGVGADGLSYRLNRTNITHNEKEQVSSYREEKFTTHVDNLEIKTITDVQFKYISIPHEFGPDVETPDSDRLKESIITTTTLNPDGSQKIETTTMNYNYNAAQQLTNTLGNSIFTGQEADWLEYTDSQKHILRRSINEKGNTTYSYITPETLETITIPAEEVTAALKQGNKYKGIAEMQYDIYYGKPIISQLHSRVSYYGQNINPGELLRIEDSNIIYENELIINIPRAINTQEHTLISSPLKDPENKYKTTRNINTDYLYDNKGNLVDAYGQGTARGYEYSDTQSWYGEYTSLITIDYSVLLGKALRTTYEENKAYKGGKE